MPALPSRSQVLSLYRQFIRNANNFSNYNYRNYFLRKAKTSFRQNKTLEDVKELNEAWNKAQRELGVLKRQSVISQMYTFDKLVVEPLQSSHDKRRH